MKSAFPLLFITAAVSALSVSCSGQANNSSTTNTTPAAASTNPTTTQPAAPATAATTATVNNTAAEEHPEGDHSEANYHTVTIESGTLTVHAAAKPNAATTGSLNNGDIVSVQETQGEWSKIMNGQIDGWVMSKYLR